MEGWTTSPSAPPTSPPSRSNPFGISTLSSLSIRLSDHLPAPLPTPSSASPRPPTPNGAADASGPGVLSPPTPAPSPSPRTKGWRHTSADSADRGTDEDHVEESMRIDEDEGAEREESMGGNTASGSKPPGSAHDLLDQFKLLNSKARFAFLSSLIGEITLPEALVLSRRIEPKLRRDFLRELPTELALHCLSYVEDARTLARASQVSRYWTGLLQDENTWREMCDRHRFTAIRSPLNRPRTPTIPQPISKLAARKYRFNTSDMTLPGNMYSVESLNKPLPFPANSSTSTEGSSFRAQFKAAYQTESNWLHGGRVLATHNSATSSVVTSLAMDKNFVVIGMADGPIHVFDSHSGAFLRTLDGHENGVWTLVLVNTVRPKSNEPKSDGSKRFNAGATKTKASYRDNGQTRRSSFNNLDAFNNATAPTSSDSGFIPRPSTVMGIGNNEDGDGDSHRKPTQSDPCNGANGWGNTRPLIVSGGCDRQVKVWDAITGDLMFSMRGHTSTVRCIKILDGRPVGVSGSRDQTVRVWDLENGRALRTLSGHSQSVRCLEVAGNKAVSGSYDYTCKLWDVDTGECIHTLRGHYHQIYAVAFDGEKIVSGSLDSTIRVWDAKTGECTSLLQGHTSLVGQLQLSGDILVTGGSDGRVIAFNLATNTCIHRLCAHDNSVTCLQFDERFIISGGNDGRIKLWDARTGVFLRELSRAGDAVWRVAYRDDQCVILLQRGGKTILEVISFKPELGVEARY